MIQNRIGTWKHTARPAILALFLLLAAGLAADYGQSWDEPGDLDYGKDSLRAYLGASDFLNHQDRMYYGPFFLMLSAAVRGVVAWIRPNWHPADVQHVLNFLSFGLAVWAFDRLSRRVLPREPAAVTTLLFATQPVLFGHGFVNQKDMPFMALFLISMELGVQACDTWVASEIPSRGERPAGAHAVDRFDAASVGLLLVGGSLLALALFNPLLRAAEAMVEQAYMGLAPPVILRWFALFAEDAHKTPLQAYLTKVQWIHFWVRVVLAILGTLVLMAAEARIRGTGSIVRHWRGGKAWWLAASAVTLGLAISIRVAAPLAGGLVSLYWITRAGKRALIPIVLYWAAAGTASYLTWPYLWPAPLAAFRQAIRVMSGFRPLPVLFDGQVFLSTELPPDYLPRLIALQLTEPAVILGGIGLFGLAMGALRKIRRRELGLILVLWTGIPVVSVAALQMPIYNNFRQVLFSLPPLFLAAGWGVAAIWRRLTGPIAHTLFTVGLLTPGVVSIVHLHPYEYAYYNTFAGGVEGAEGKYELDYWCTGYREATAYVNRTAPTGATVVVFGPDPVVRSFARPDLDIRPDWDPIPNPNYVLACGSTLFSSWFYGDLPVVFEVQRGGGLMAVVKKP